MPTLTYESYPAIVDAVIGLSSVATCLQLRLVCKSYRAAIDREQLRHIVLTPDGDDGARVHGAVLPSIAALRKVGPSSWTQLPEHPALHLAKHVRVLDVRGHFPASCNLALLRDAFPNLAVFRITTDRGGYTPYVPFRAETLVVFTSPIGGACRPLPSLSDESDAEDLDDEPVVPDNVPPMSEQITKIVVNMSGDDYPVADMFRFVLDPPPHIREITIFIPRYVMGSFRLPDGSEGHRMGLMGDKTCAENIIAMDLAELMVGVPHVRYTLIGVEDIPWPKARFRRLVRAHLAGFGYDGVEYGEDRPQIVCSWEEGRTTRLPRTEEVRKLHEAKVDETLARLTLLTLDKYISVFGKERTMVETLELMDGTERPVRHGIVPSDLRRMGPAAKNAPVSSSMSGLS